MIGRWMSLIEQKLSPALQIAFLLVAYGIGLRRRGHHRQICAGLFKIGGAFGPYGFNVVFQVCEERPYC